MKKHRILYIEDELHLARIVQETLERKGFEVLHRKDGTRLHEQLRSFNPDACVLDVMLPYIDGFTLGSAIRNLYPRLPILFLTAKTQTADVLEGFSAGGSDYLRKPFSLEELVVRLETQIRLAGADTGSATESSNEEQALGTIRFHPGRHHLTYEDGSQQRLSNREAQVLALLAQHRNKTLDRRKLLQAVWGDDSFFNSRTLDVYIRKLREFLAADERIRIITLKGQGYHFFSTGLK